MPPPSTPFLQKYAPKAFSDLVFANDKQEAIVRTWAHNASLQPLLFHGPPGIGKTSVAKVCANELYGGMHSSNVKHFSADEGITTPVLRDLFDEFAGSAPLPTDQAAHRLMIIDEVESLKRGVQKSVKGLLDKYSSNCHFIFTTNEIKKIDSAVENRCHVIEFVPPDAGKWLPRIKYVLEAEKVRASSDEKWRMFVAQRNGNGRNLLRELEQYVYGAEEYEAKSSSTVRKR